ncbi:uncharacterized protein LOC113513054 [Galleria mellonella]|uniref:Uncharacterized protein LOC113513054 n=1 Tax=Galleria mellonella TaxID=7137 RepID=A0ABM3MC88_GALME|nr:uncharacterized protein LOC113513054 [Galleria mellonella]
MNDIIKVATLRDCNDNTDLDAIKLDPTWRHSMFGCKCVEVLRDMFKFKLGFLLRRPYESELVMSDFYWQPFTPPLWFSLFSMCIVATLVFYLLVCWENRIFGRHIECSFFLEILLAIGGYCQHSFPVESVFTSRRIGYFTFFLFSYVIFSFYTSNLLSRLVIDEDYDMDLGTLGKSDYKCVILENIIHGNGNITDCETAISLDFVKLVTVNISTGLEAVRSNKTALLSDFTTLYSEIHKSFSNTEICELIEIDILSDLKKYIVSSKNFRHKELFKIGISRLHELGLIHRFTFHKTLQYTLSSCFGAPPISLDFTHVSTPYLILGFSYVLSIVIMLGERWHYNRNRLWPYVN